jgi:hypothetical protein
MDFSFQLAYFLSVQIYRAIKNGGLTGQISVYISDVAIISDKYIEANMTLFPPPRTYSDQVIRLGFDLN